MWITLSLTWSNDEWKARNRSRLGNISRWGSGFFWGLELVRNPPRRPPAERRPCTGAVASETDTPQAGNHPVCQRHGYVWTRRFINVSPEGSFCSEFYLPRRQGWKHEACCRSSGRCSPPEGWHYALNGRNWKKHEDEDCTGKTKGSGVQDVNSASRL